METENKLTAEQITRQITYWLDLADYDIETARAMLATERLLYVGFMCHQVVEKALKGMFIERCKITPPKVHALVALANKAGVFVEMTTQQQEFLETLDPLNLDSRYPADKNKILSSMTEAT